MGDDRGDEQPDSEDGDSDNREEDESEEDNAEEEDDDNDDNDNDDDHDENDENDEEEEPESADDLRSDLDGKSLKLLKEYAAKEGVPHLVDKAKKTNDMRQSLIDLLVSANEKKKHQAET